MAKVVVTAKIMPSSPDEDLKRIEIESLKAIAKLVGKGDTRVKIEPVAFGLNSINITFITDESLGSPDAVEDDIMKIPGVNSWQVIDVRRAIG
jgi:translation elongation factor aEF-1 beta